MLISITVFYQWLNYIIFLVLFIFYLFQKNHLYGILPRCCLSPTQLNSMTLVVGSRPSPEAAPAGPGNSGFLPPRRQVVRLLELKVTIGQQAASFHRHHWARLSILTVLHEAHEPRLVLAHIERRKLDLKMTILPGSHRPTCGSTLNGMYPVSLMLLGGWILRADSARMPACESGRWANSAGSIFDDMVMSRRDCLPSVSSSGSPRDPLSEIFSAAAALSAPFDLRPVSFGAFWAAAFLVDLAASFLASLESDLRLGELLSAAAAAVAAALVDLVELRVPPRVGEGERSSGVGVSGGMRGVKGRRELELHAPVEVEAHSAAVYDRNSIIKLDLVIWSPFLKQLNFPKFCSKNTIWSQILFSIIKLMFTICR